jgi:hypothetical protein
MEGFKAFISKTFVHEGIVYPEIVSFNVFTIPGVIKFDQGHKLLRSASGMKWIWIILAIALVLGPVMWLMPSATQSRQAKLRTRAIALGLDVKIAEMPQVRRALVRKEDTVMGAVYRYRHPEKHLGSSWMVRREPGHEWEEEGLAGVPLPQRELLQQLQSQLPADVYAIEQSDFGVGMYWTERGDVPTVERCAQQLRQLQALSG